MSAKSEKCTPCRRQRLRASFSHFYLGRGGNPSPSALPPWGGGLALLLAQKRMQKSIEKTMRKSIEKRAQMRPKMQPKWAQKR